MRIDVISLFPDFVAQVAAFGVVGRAVERGLLSVHGWNPRDHASGNYRRVDDRPFGGGPGMVMLVDPLRSAIHAAREDAQCVLHTHSVNGVAVSATLLDSFDPAGKVQLHFRLTAGALPLYQTVLATPANQIVYVNRQLPAGDRLILGVGAR